MTLLAAELVLGLVVLMAVDVLVIANLVAALRRWRGRSDGKVLDLR